MALDLLRAATVRAMIAHARRAWPEEACGFVFRSGQVLEARNVLDALHAADPAKWPRTAREGYYVSPDDLLRVADQIAAGDPVTVVYHSHPGRSEAKLSPEDVQGALSGEPTPQFPDALQLVIALESAEGPWHLRGYQYWPAEGFVGCLSLLEHA